MLMERFAMARTYRWNTLLFTVRYRCMCVCMINYAVYLESVAMSSCLMAIPRMRMLMHCKQHHVVTWGEGSAGQLGHGNVSDITAPKVVMFFAEKGVAQIAAGTIW